MFTNIEDVSTKQVYWHLLSGISQRPTSEKKWNEKLDFEIDELMWNIIYTNNLKINLDTYITNFQFKITHRILACNYNLKIWKINESNCCDFCSEVDTIEHFLVHCDNTYSFWQRIFNWWAISIKVWLQVDTYEIVFGIPNDTMKT